MDITTVVDVLTKAGPWAVAAILYLWMNSERKERLDSQRWLQGYLERDTVVKESIASSLRSLRFSLFRKGAIAADAVETDDHG